MKMLAALALVFACGCSVVLTRSKPRPPPRDCAGYAPAIIDATLTAALVALSVWSYRENHCDSIDGCHTYDPTNLFAVPALGFSLSTLWGFSGEHSCRVELAKRPEQRR